MAYQVIARKYRPQRFEEVVGQEHVTQTLTNAIAQNRIAHAYLFVGPRGIGKTTLARIFAKCLNSSNGPTVSFSEEDPRVKEITEGRSLDVLEIDGASNRGIEEVRELRETVKYAPASGRFKIYIIDEVHMLTKEAFNALLKTLEEPPAHVKFFFATTEPEKVLPTILSRCQRFDLRRIPSALIVGHLQKIADKEGVKIEKAALHAIARGADGGMRDAQSTLEQLISFCRADITEADVLSMFGLASQGQILALSDAVLDGEQEKALRLLNDLAGQGKDLGRLVVELMHHFRNLLVWQVSRGDTRLIEASEEELAKLAEQSSGWSAEGVTRMIEVLADCDWRMRETASRKILLEITLLKMIQARQAVSLDTVLKQVQQLRAEAGSPARASGAKPAAGVSKASPPLGAAPTTAPAPASASGEELERLWARLVDAFGRANPFMRTYFTTAHPVSLAKNLLTIGFDPEFADNLRLVDNPQNHALLRTKLGELGYGNIQVKFIEHQAELKAQATQPETAPAEGARAKQAGRAGQGEPARAGGVAEGERREGQKEQAAVSAEEDFRNDPLIQKALETFKGQIVEVRS